MTVFIRPACPGQSTRVNYKKSIPLRRSLLPCSSSFCLSQSGTATTKAENPRSKVMPRSLLYGLLSNPAVEATVLNALHRDVLPEST
jgi:hypothetical protein